MTVGELKAKLEQFPDDLRVYIPNEFCYLGEHEPDILLVQSVCRGVNEYDNCLIIDA